MRLLRFSMFAGVAVLGLGFGGCSVASAQEKANGPGRVASAEGANSVEILLDNAEVHAGDPVKGQYVFRNNTSRKLTIPVTEFPRVRLMQSSGLPVEHSKARMMICGTSAANAPPIEIGPGGRNESSFELGTDPLALGGGYQVSPGVYRVSADDLKDRFGVVTLVRPVAVTILAADNVRVGERIVSLAAGGERVSLLRENGVLESFSILSGRRVGSSKLDSYAVGDEYASNEKFSEDAMMFAAFRHWTRGDQSRPPISVRLDRENAPVRVLSQPAWFSKWERPSIVVVDSEHDRLGVCQWRVGFGWIDLKDDSSPCLIDLRDREFVTSGGAYILAEGDQRVTARPLAGGPAIRLDQAGDEPEGVQYIGRSHALLGVYRSGKYRLVSYDGRTISTIVSGSQSPQAISPDGRFVVTGTSTYDYVDAGKAGELSVWDAAGAKTLFLLKDGRQRTPYFSGDSSKLVCGIVQRGAARVSWFGERVEVYDIKTGILERTIELGSKK